MTETAERALSLLQGDKPYHLRARAALPKLVRQARAHQTIEYGELARELGMPNARNLNYPLGAIGQTMLELGDRLGRSVPPIQAVVVNKAKGLPGEGLALFAPDAEEFSRATTQERREIVRGMLARVFTFQHWDRVLEELSLEPEAFLDLPAPEELQRGEGGEGENHRALKELVAEMPELVGARGLESRIEAPLLSGDFVDVLFSSSRRKVGVEVKGERSPPNDIVRGIFQCEKYQAVLEAEARATGRRVDVEVVLVLGGSLPEDLRPLVTTLGRRVIDGVTAL